MTEAKENPFLKFWHWYTEGQNAWHIATSSGVTLFVVWATPAAEWKTAVPWLVSAFAFSGTWCVVQLIRGTLRRIHRWWRPPSVSVSISNGVKATIRLTHKGPATTYSADARIVSVLGNREVNPAEQLFRCQMQFKGTEGDWETTLNDDDWCHIVLGEILFGSPVTSISVRRGPRGNSVGISDRGGVLEYTIRSRPPLPGGRTLTKRFRLVVNEKRNALIATEEAM